MTREPLLEAIDLHKHFGGVAAIDGASFLVDANRLYAIIGPNGAGKSTFFNLITNLLAPDSGKVLFKGRDVTYLPPWKICVLGIVRTFQLVSVFPKLTCLDSVQIAMLAAKRRTRNLWCDFGKMSTERDRAASILESIGLGEFEETVVDSLAYGARKKLELGMALAADPELLLLDEPAAGLNPGERIDMMELVSELSHTGGLSIIYVEHDMDAVLPFAERISVLHQGRFIAEGSPEDIVANDLVQEIYLGGVE